MPQDWQSAVLNRRMAEPAPNPRPAMVVAFEDSLDDSEAQWPPRHALASLLEENFYVRKNLREGGRMLTWPKPELTGLATLQALSLNRMAISDALQIWGSHSKEEVKSPPVEWLKDEAMVSKKFSVYKLQSIFWFTT